MSGQNTSTAVMQRRVEPKDSLDDFPTPCWGTRALCEFLSGPEVGLDLSGMTVREPCANRGYMVRPLAEYFDRVIASDVEDYGVGFAVSDFLRFGVRLEPAHFTIMNPPFRAAERFIQRALRSSQVGCAALVRTSFIEGIRRYESLFSQVPPSYVLQFVERLPIVRGRVDAKASSATSYVWLVWIDGHRGTKLHWIPKCRKVLERPGDYDPPIEALS